MGVKRRVAAAKRLWCRHVAKVYEGDTTKCIADKCMEWQELPDEYIADEEPVAMGHCIATTTEVL